jgi:hypothetical protein
MPVKRRINKKRNALPENARAWLEGRPCGFFEFKRHEDLIQIWEVYGDLDVATWDMKENTNPVAAARPYYHRHCNQGAGIIPQNQCFTSKTARFVLIVGALSISAVSAQALSWDDANPITQTKKAVEKTKEVVKDNTPSSVDITVNPKNPLTPVKVEVKTPSGSMTVEPSPVPAPPVVHAEGNGFIATAINNTNDFFQAPKNFIDQKGREINDGFIHLGNEIGMLWANFKHNMEQKVADFFQWLKAQAEKYGIYALAGIGALFLLRGFLHFMIGRGHTARHA